MPSKNTGKIITKIKINKKNVVLHINGKERLEITNDAYASSYLYVGKVLDSKTIKQLKEFSLLTKYLNYAMSLLKKGHYSEWKMREKLYAKEAKKNEVDKVIKKLKEVSLIDDKALIYDHLEWCKERNIGKNKILKELNDKGVFETELAKLSFPYTKEKQKALYWVPKLEKKYSKYSYEKKKQHVYSGLISLGFDSGVANEVLNSVSSRNEKDEKSKLKIDFEKIYNRLSNKYEGYELQTKVFNSLKNKGYRYSDIKKMWEVNNHDDWGIC